MVEGMAMAEKPVAAREEVMVMAVAAREETVMLAQWATLVRARGARESKKDSSHKSARWRASPMDQAIAAAKRKMEAESQTLHVSKFFLLTGVHK